MIKVQWHNKIRLAKSYIEKKKRAEVIVILDEVYKEVKRNSIVMTPFEFMEMLGLIANCYNEASKLSSYFVSKEIIILEELCNVALAEIVRLKEVKNKSLSVQSNALLASSQGLTVEEEVANHISATAGDFIKLGRAYLRNGDIEEGRKAIEKAKELLSEIGKTINVNEIIETTLQEMDKRKKSFWKRLFK